MTRRAKGAVVLCIGNQLRGDDAFGLLVYRLLRRLGLPAVYAGASPENAARHIRALAPELVIVVDALLDGSSDLTVAKITGDSPPRLLTTHGLPLEVLLRAAGLDNCQIIAVGARAENLEVGSRPSRRVRRLAVQAASFLVKLLTYSPSEPQLSDEGSFVARDVEDSAPGQQLPRPPPSLLGNHVHLRPSEGSVTDVADLTFIHPG